jgi:UDP-N-acetyl-D-galactosamine dehydrogenase
MGRYIAGNTIKQLIASGRSVKKSKVLILGFTFKEDISDVRNTKVIDIYRELREYGVQVFVHDPYADKEEVLEEYGITLLQKPNLKRPYDGIILAVKHREYTRYSPVSLRKLCNGKPVFIDIKAFFDEGRVRKAGFHYWRL